MRRTVSAFDGESLITPDSIAAEISRRWTETEDTAYATARTELALLLHIAFQSFELKRDAGPIVRGLARDLHALSVKYGHQVWHELVPFIQGHQICDYLLHDPFTRWSFEKPRGYSGDAHLLDFIYLHPSVEEEIASASALGRRLYDCTKVSQSSDAVRERRDVLARMVDDISERTGGKTEILTIAAGHLREALSSDALQSGRVKRWVALDQDPLSVGSMIRDFRGTRVEPLDGSVKGILKGIYKLGSFDFVYAAGLYDYLPDGVAIRLTRKCLDMLKPGGTFLFANFSDELVDDAYMEAFMKWSLLLRSRGDVRRIVDASVTKSGFATNVYRGKNRSMVYATITKL